MSEQRKEYKIDGRTPTIYRVVKNKDNPYVMIDRRPVDNPDLSFKAKGILTYLLSRPDGWEVSVADLIKHGIEGEAAIRSGLKELKNARHMKYTTSRKQGRITGWLIEVFEIPFSPDSDFQDVDFQDVENRTQVLSTLSSTELKDGVPPSFGLDWKIATNQDVTEQDIIEQSDKQRIDAANLIAMGTGINSIAIYNLAYAFMTVRQIVIPSESAKGNRKAAQEMLKMHVAPVHIVEATKKLLEAKMTVTDLFSIKKTAIDLANKPAEIVRSSMIRTIGQ